MLEKPKAWKLGLITQGHTTKQDRAVNTPLSSQLCLPKLPGSLTFLLCFYSHEQGFRGLDI